MNNVREVNRINEKELELAVEGGASWHDDYKDSAYIFVGGLDKRLTEGDVISIFSQYGEILDINVPRIPEGGLRDRNGDNGPSDSGSRSGRENQQQQQQAGGKPGDRRGFGFLLYEDQRSTVMAVDNLNGFNLLGRTIRVDHVKDYKMPGAKRREEEGERVEPSRNAAPAIINASDSDRDDDDSKAAQDLDLADPMAAYIAAARKEKGNSKEEKEERRRRKEERRERREEKERRKRAEVDKEPSLEMRRQRRDDNYRHQSSGRRGDRRSLSPLRDDVEERRRYLRREAELDHDGAKGHERRQYFSSNPDSRDHHERQSRSRNDGHDRGGDYFRIR